MAVSNSNEQKNVAEAMSDRISSLPDHLLFHILSILPFKHAATTRVLSKSWKSLWLSIPSLDFDDGIDDPLNRNPEDLQRDYDRFVRFVNSLLIPRHEHPIKRFHLKCAFSSNPSDISDWVNNVMRLTVEELEISLLYFTNGMSLASNVFLSTTIVVLKLNSLTMNNFFAVYLPSLKILHLEYVTLPCECLSMVLSSCRALEDLVIESIRFTTADSWCECESLPNLVRANIQSNLFIPLKVFCNVEILQLWPYFYYDPADTPTFHNLVSMEITFYDCNWEIVVNILQNSPMLQNLVIDKKHTRKYLDTWRNPELVPGCISSHLKTFCVRGLTEHVICVLPFANFIMENAGVLQTMKICCMNPFVRHLMIKKISSFPRSSPRCKVVSE